MTNITFGSSVTNIGIDWAGTGYDPFIGTDLKTIYLLNPTPPEINRRYDFADDICENVTLYVPEGSLEAYKNAYGWANFVNIQEFDPTGISGVEATADMDVSVEGGSIVVSGAQGNVAVYSLSGAMVGRAKGGSRAVVAVPGPGVYVVKAGEKAVKVRINNE